MLPMIEMNMPLTSSRIRTHHHHHHPSKAPAMTTDAKHQKIAAKLPLPLSRSFDQSCH
jgi:hypothetical protein